MTNSRILRFVVGFGLAAILLSACGPKPVPGEKDRERGEQAVDQLPK